jgi:hypothetical protein
MVIITTQRNTNNTTGSSGSYTVSGTHVQNQNISTTVTEPIATVVSSEEISDGVNNFYYVYTSTAVEVVSGALPSGMSVALQPSDFTSDAEFPDDGWTGYSVVRYALQGVPTVFGTFTFSIRVITFVDRYNEATNFLLDGARTYSDQISVTITLQRDPNLAPIITAPTNGATVGSVITISGDYQYNWRIDGNNITSTPEQSFKYVVLSSGTHTISARTLNNVSTTISVTVDLTEPSLSLTIPSWYIDGIYIGQNYSIPNIQLPAGSHQIEGRLADALGGTVSSTYTINISSSNFLDYQNASVTEVDAVVTSLRLGSSDLNQIFAGLSGLTPRPTATGYKVKTSVDPAPVVYTDLSQLFAQLSDGTAASVTGFQVGGADLNTIFAARNSL